MIIWNKVLHIMQELVAVVFDFFQSGLGLPSGHNPLPGAVARQPANQQSYCSWPKNCHNPLKQLFYLLGSSFYAKLTASWL